MSVPHASKYDNASINHATNPSDFGHHHGPILNANHGWQPHRQQVAVRLGLRAPQVMTTDNATAPNIGAVLSTVNTGVCDIAVNGNQLCGAVFQSGISQQPSLRRHVRNQYPGALVNPDKQNVAASVLIAGQNALKLFVRSGAWRDMDYLHEPGSGPVGGYLDVYATEMEAIARIDANFAATYGTHFHRADLSSSRKRKLGISSAYTKPALVPLSESAINARTTTAVESQRIVAPAPKSGRHRNHGRARARIVAMNSSDVEEGPEKQESTPKRWLGDRAVSPAMRVPIRPGEAKNTPSRFNRREVASKKSQKRNKSSAHISPPQAFSDASSSPRAISEKDAEPPSALKIVQLTSSQRQKWDESSRETRDLYSITPLPQQDNIVRPPITQGEPDSKKFEPKEPTQNPPSTPPSSADSSPRSILPLELDRSRATTTSLFPTPHTQKSAILRIFHHGVTGFEPVSLAECMTVDSFFATIAHAGGVARDDIESIRFTFLCMSDHADEREMIMRPANAAICLQTLLEEVSRAMRPEEGGDRCVVKVLIFRKG